MDLARLKTFPFVAAAVVVLAGLFGLAIGSLTSVDAPSASGREAAPPPRWDYSPAKPDAPRRKAPDAPVQPRPPEPPPPALRTLEPGRVDELVTRERSDKPDSSILLTMEDEQGTRMMPSSITLAINTPGLGWQAVPGAGQPIGEGRVKYDKLFPGEYRVRSENPNYAPIEEIVQLAPAEVDRHVRFIVKAAQRAQVTFIVKLPDESVPEFVTIQIFRGDGARGKPRGRFEEAARSESGGLLESTTGRYTPGKETGGIPMHVAAGRPTRFVFAATVDQRNYGAEITVNGEPGEQRVDVRLAESAIGKDMIGDGEPRRAARLEAQFLMDGKAARITSASLRQNLGDRAARESSRKEGDVFVWENVMSGRWWLCAWGPDIQSVYVKQVDIGAAERQSFEISRTHIRVNVAVEAGSPESGAKMRYEVRVTPKGFAIERGHRGDLTGKKDDYIDFFVPDGSYTINVHSAGGVPLDFDPAEIEASVSGAGTFNANFTARTSATVSFQCMTAAGLPVPSVEFLLTTRAAGKVPQAERARLKRGNPDGTCTAAAPAGAVYLMIWSTSTDWNNPDKVFRLDLPVGGVKDLGGVVIAP